MVVPAPDEVAVQVVLFVAADVVDEFMAVVLVDMEDVLVVVTLPVLEE